MWLCNFCGVFRGGYRVFMECLDLVIEEVIQCLEVVIECLDVVIEVVIQCLEVVIECL